MPSPIAKQPQPTPVVENKKVETPANNESKAYSRYEKVRDGYNKFCSSPFSKTANPICSNNTGVTGASFATAKTLTAMTVLFVLANPAPDSKNVKPNIADLAFAAQLNRLSTNPEGQQVVGSLQSSQSAFNPNLAVSPLSGLPNGTLGNIYLAHRYNEYKAAQKSEHSHEHQLEAAVAAYALTTLVDFAAAKLLKKPADETSTQKVYFKVNPGIKTVHSVLGGADQRIEAGYTINF